LNNESFHERVSRLKNCLNTSLEKKDQELVRYYSYLLYLAYEIESSYNLSYFAEYISQSFYYFYGYCSLSISAANIDKSLDNTSTKLYSILSQIRNSNFFNPINEDSLNLLRQFRENIEVKHFQIGQSITRLKEEYFKILRTISKNQTIPLGILKFLLYRESQLSYLQSVLVLLVHQKNPHVSKGSINSPFAYAFDSTCYYPLHYFSHNILQYSPSLNQKERLSQNHFSTNLTMNMSHGYNGEGVRINRLNKFDEASQIYSHGINQSLPGNKYLLFYNAAKNYQDKCYSLNQFNNEEIEFSIRYGYESIYDSMINLDKCIEPFQQFNSDHWLNCINLIGLSLEKKDERNKAISLLNSSVNLYLELLKYNNSPKQIAGDCFNNLGLFYMRNEKYSLALEAFYKALEHNPQKPYSALLNISNCYFQQEEYQSSISTCYRIISNSDFSDSHHDALHNLILSYSRVYNLEEIKLIENEYNKMATKKDFLFLAKTYNYLGDNESLMRCLINAEDSSSPLYFHFLSLIEKDNNNYSSSNRHFKMFLSLSISQMLDNCKKYDKKEFDSQIYYKFRDLKENSNTFEMLKNNYIYFHDFSKLNDPFDCRLISEYNNNPAMKYGFEDIGDPKVMSLSMSNNNQLLWSHYADEHKGLCIGYKFDIEGLIENKIISNIVKYSKIQKSLNRELLENLASTAVSEHKKMPLLSDTHLLNTMIVKSEEWEYEREFRLINFDKNKISNNGFFTISNVTFGFRCKTIDIKLALKKMIEGYGTPVLESPRSNSVTFGKMEVVFSKKILSKDIFFGLVDDPDFNIIEYL
jgi:Protein of unknown function (DUF2971)/Tetratricopeptide repeat